MEYDLNAMIYQPCFLKIDEVAYVDKGRNLAVALGERDVKVRSRDVFCFDLFFLQNFCLNFVWISFEVENVSGRCKSEEQEREKGLQSSSGLLSPTFVLISFDRWRLSICCCFGWVWPKQIFLVEFDQQKSELACLGCCSFDRWRHSRLGCIHRTGFQIQTFKYTNISQVGSKYPQLKNYNSKNFWDQI